MFGAVLTSPWRLASSRLDQLVSWSNLGRRELDGPFYRKAAYVRTDARSLPTRGWPRKDVVVTSSCAEEQSSDLDRYISLSVKVTDIQMIEPLIGITP